MTMTSPLIDVSSVFNQTPEPNVTYQVDNETDSNPKVVMKDFIWEVARAFEDEDSSIPAWSGFNALVSTKTVPVAKMRYLPFINASPSDMSTILVPACYTSGSGASIFWVPAAALKHHEHDGVIDSNM